MGTVREALGNDALPFGRAGTHMYLEVLKELTRIELIYDAVIAFKKATFPFIPYIFTVASAAVHIPNTIAASGHPMLVACWLADRTRKTDQARGHQGEMGGGGR